MDDVIYRSFLGELSDVELRRLTAWRKATPENQAHYQELERLWELTGPERAPERQPPPGVLRKVVAEAERHRSAPVEVAKRGSSRWLWAAAAAVSLTVGGGWMVSIWTGTSQPLAAAEFATGHDETVTVTLNDGSFVRLGPTSRLTFSANPDGREVRLVGWAYFAVAKDPKRPFRVTTRAGTAVALGTRFEVRLEGDAMRLVVVEGRVALTGGGGRIEVAAGEVSHIRGEQPPSVVKVDAIQALLDWTKGLLVFQATPLPQVADELERHYGVRVSITSPQLADRLVTGWFENEKLEVVVTTICRVTQTSCAIRGDSVILRP